MMLHDTTFAAAQDLASACARRTMNTWHVLDDRGHYLIADDADAAAWGDRVVWTVEPEMAFSAIELGDGLPPYCSTCGDDGDCPDCDPLNTAPRSVPAPTLRHNGLPNPLYRVQMAELDPPGDSPLGDDEGDTLPSLYACLVAECQAELDARMAVPVVLDVEFSPVGW